MQANSDPQDPALLEKTLAMRTAFKGRALTLDVVEIELPDGRRSTREIVRHRGAVAVLARASDGRFLFVRQYRKAIEQVFTEVVAGSLEPGEAPLSCARRELREESGFAARTLRSLGSIVACPGYSEERLHLFYAELEATPGEPEPDGDENVQTLLLTAAEVEAGIRSGRIDDAKTLACWLRWRMLPENGADRPANGGGADA